MLPEPLRRLIHQLSRFPGVGEKTAQRFALFLLQNQELAEDLGLELSHLKERLRTCENCGHLAEVDSEGVALCSICRDPRRDPHLLCVVARIQDLLAIERSTAMKGRYFVLGRLLSPLDGIGPDELPVHQLMQRIETEQIQEIILATPPSVDGEATALYLDRELAPRGVTVTRIASGVPHGGDLEFADQITLGRAIEGRRNLR